MNNKSPTNWIEVNNKSNQNAESLMQEQEYIYLRNRN